MKNIFFMLLITCLSQVGISQKIYEKHMDFSSGKSIDLDIQIADSIRIIAWTKNEVYAKMSVDINDNKGNEYYKVDFEQSGSGITIRSKFDMPHGRNCCGDSSDCNCNCNCHSQIYLDVYVPEKAGFRVKTINGSITISGKTGEIRAESISGFIDLALPATQKTDLRMKTISGTMYSDFDFPSEGTRGRHVGGTDVDAELNGSGGNSVDLKTISGNIFLRKA
jgi:hypothetical protein